MDWHMRGACLDKNSELFFPIGNSDLAHQQIDEAKEICLHCTVREECLAWALEFAQVHGVWGGTSEIERLVLRARRRAELTPAPKRPEVTREPVPSRGA
ncbi:WhiB family transcriptional regulator [Kribbella sp. NPDC023855]|uniref:WhiB family transcriptional regulator n=1 Tax=Kribbella sp. NPDC023855 TaxID=3154698 RepID=UPI0034091F49